MTKILTPFEKLPLAKGWRLQAGMPLYDSGERCRCGGAIRSRTRVVHDETGGRAAVMQCDGCGELSAAPLALSGIGAPRVLQAPKVLEPESTS